VKFIRALGLVRILIYSSSQIHTASGWHSLALNVITMKCTWDIQTRLYSLTLQLSTILLNTKCGLRSQVERTITSAKHSCASVLQTCRDGKRRQRRAQFCPSTGLRYENQLGLCATPIGQRTMCFYGRTYLNCSDASSLSPGHFIAQVTIRVILSSGSASLWTNSSS
jgi:hypothetical protein